MDVNKYEVLVKTIELGSLTKAGQALGYTQSGISHILNSLEADCGVKLLIRSRTGVYLNAAGEELYPYIKSVCDSNRRLVEKINELHGIESGVVRIGAVTSISTHWLPKLIQSFCLKHPNILFQLQNGEYSEIESWLQKGEVDMGFLKMPVQTHLKVYPLTRDRMVVILPKGHPLTAMKAIPHRSLTEYPFILYVDGIDSEFKDILDKYEIAANAQFTAKDDYAIMAMVESGMGISVLPELVLTRCPYEVESRELNPPVHRDLVIAVKQSDTLVPAARQFLKHILSSGLR